MARVYVSFMRLPTPKGPPAQPVFTSQQAAWWRRSFSPSSDGVGGGGTREERRSETGAEGRLRLFAETALGAGHFGRVAAQEVIHGLLGREARDRRQHAEGVRGQEDHVAGMAADARDHGVVDEVERVGGARVLGDLVGVEMEQAGVANP